jgi:hypothetical protein
MPNTLVVFSAVLRDGQSASSDSYNVSFTYDKSKLIGSRWSCTYSKVLTSADVPDVSNLASKSEVNAVSGTLQTEIVAISGTMVDVPTGVSGVVAGSGIAITASGSDYVISCTVTGGGSTYTAGDYISIDNDTISVTGITDLVAGNNITITASGSSAIISGQAGGSTYTAGAGIDITNNTISVDDTIALKSEIPDNVRKINFTTNTRLYREQIEAWLNSNKFVYLNILPANVPSSPGDLQYIFAHGGGNLVLNNLTDNYVTFSGICHHNLTNKDYNVVFNYGFYSYVWTYSCSRIVTPSDIPDTSTFATKTELNTKQDTLTGITDVQVVQSLPVSPVSSVLYLIPEA